MDLRAPIKRLGVIVPYRNREEHLKQFIPYINNFLSDVPHHIYVVEQTEEKPFNRGSLLNIGFLQAKTTCDYVCFHDVDMLPVSADYSYCSAPTHLATNVEQFGYQMPYSQYFGGVTLFNSHDFALINGYHNGYFGWGLEDDDLRLRCFFHGLTVESRQGTFLSLPHPHAEETNLDTRRNRQLFERFYRGDITLLADGLDSLQFTILQEISLPDFSRILVRF
ncbi:MAG: galactosyltransferase-related protein [Parachlamydiaceae bacterium]